MYIEHSLLEFPRRWDMVKCFLETKAKTNPSSLQSEKEGYCPQSLNFAVKDQPFSKTKSMNHIMIKKSMDKNISPFLSKPISIMQAFTAFWAIKNKEIAAFLELKWKSLNFMIIMDKNYILCNNWGFSLIFSKFEPHLRNLGISLFFIAQRAVKTRIIENGLD